MNENAYAANAAVVTWPTVITDAMTRLFSMYRGIGMSVMAER